MANRRIYIECLWWPGIPNVAHGNGNIYKGNCIIYSVSKADRLLELCLLSEMVQSIAGNSWGNKSQCSMEKGSRENKSAGEIRLFSPRTKLNLISYIKPRPLQPVWDAWMEIGKGFGKDLPLTGSIHMLITSLELIQDTSVLLCFASAFLILDSQLEDKEASKFEEIHLNWHGPL